MDTLSFSAGAVDIRTQPTGKTTGRNSALEAGANDLFRRIAASCAASRTPPMPADILNDPRLGRLTSIVLSRFLRSYERLGKLDQACEYVHHFDLRLTFSSPAAAAWFTLFTAAFNFKAAFQERFDGSEHYSGDHGRWQEDPSLAAFPVVGAEALHPPAR